MISDNNLIGYTKNNNKHPHVIGAVEWFRIGEFEQVEKALDQLKALSFKELRTGISWADYYTKDGKKWFNWLIPTLAKEVNLLPCFLYTPPSIGIEPKTSSPPKNPKDYADFLDIIIKKFDPYFEWVELWNEPNNRTEYDYTLDHNWEIFSEMIGGAAYWMKHLQKKTVLGGMSPIDPNWLEMMYKRGVMEYIDAIGLHGFPSVFDTMWEGWETNISRVNKIIKDFDGNQEVWITETGFSTWQYDEQRQLKEFINAIEAPVKRMYWYSINDLNPELPTVDGFHLDEREYHFGLIKKNENQKLLYRLLHAHGVDGIKENKWLSDSFSSLNGNKNKNHALVTGGAGFIGTNLVDKLLNDGYSVTILDNLSRPGVEINLKWLLRKHKHNLKVEIADIRNEFIVQKLVNTATVVFHFAAQVAVTTSCKNPIDDFEINAKGTINILEAIRLAENPPPLIFTSTNKVYGGLEDINIHLKDSRYEPADLAYADYGISEERKLDFHSPYGCSKGTADSYIIDYVRTFDIKAIIFRMSCIYGHHQCGTEDQGWVAHFLISALKGNPITIFGDGLQVRDILFVEDLVNAFDIAYKNIDRLSGHAFNIGGGVENSISLQELIKDIEEIHGEEIMLEFGDWRPGDQKYYVSDIRKFHEMTGWYPKITAKEGVHKLYNWLKETQPINNMMLSSKIL
ncbi:MAG: GDP-mannose 4,6-dehydratase [Bacteroidota bacterium]|nr:GDP-mannose 4,6-dehydratase [Bacteroidota bacterium]